MSSATPFVYDLPEDRIAQRPVEPPDAARLLVIDRRSGTLTDKVFRDLPDFLQPGDVLVLNDTAVIPARFYGRTQTGAAVELLLVRKVSLGEWCALARPMKRLKVGTGIELEGGIRAEVLRRHDATTIAIAFRRADGAPAADAELHGLGQMPIPPYIRSGRSDEQDRRDYQTIFASNPGSVAAPTASLHFTERVRDAVVARGVTLCFVTLHLNTASFLPLERDGQPLVPPGQELFHVSAQSWKLIQQAKREGRRVVAVGTSAVRCLESAARAAEPCDVFQPTELFITPGFEFRIVDAVVTNFHQPGTTHILLVQALLGDELLSRAYHHALDNGYRFLSYGDATVIL